MPNWKLIALATAATLASQGCGSARSPSVRPVPVAGIDQQGASLDRARQLVRGTGETAVMFELGQPADRVPSCLPGEVVWRYPIRAWSAMAVSRKIVPAVFLRMTFDPAGTLTDWRFVDPLTGRQLPVVEEPAEAARWFESLSRSPAPIPPRIELQETLVRGRTTQHDVEGTLGRWQPDLHCGNGGAAPLVRKENTDSGAVWDWYADRPSPLFIPPHYLVASFAQAGTLIVWHFEQTYPGGRK